MSYKEYPEPIESLYRIQRALAGYVSYQAACQANESFTEYQLYDTILRILMMRGFKARCEFSCSDFLKKEKTGDHKKIDFVATKGRVRFALEVKWHRPKGKRIVRTLNVRNDQEKLAAFRKEYPASKSYLCIVGTFKKIGEIKLSPNSFFESNDLKAIYARFGRTQFGCRIYQLNS